MTKYTYHEFRDIEPFTEPLSIARHPRIARDYLNSTLDKLAEHLDSPNRSPNVALGSFSQHIAPNTGTAGLLQWMLTHSKLVETIPNVGISRFTDARLTDLGAETLLVEYRKAKRMPSGHVDEAIAIEREVAEAQLDKLRTENDALRQELQSFCGGAAVSNTVINSLPPA